MRNSGFKKLSYAEALEKRKQQQTKSRRKKSGYQKSETEWKQQVRLRDNYTCQYPGCKVKDDHIHCHHIAPRSQRKDLLYVVYNGICVCFRHHDWIHQHPLEAVEMGLLSKETRELVMKEVLPYPGED